MSAPDIKPLEDRLDVIIALLRILAGKEIEERRRTLLSTRKKQEIYELCDGTNEMSTIARKVKVTGEYVRLTIKDLENAGFVIIKQEGGKKYPTRVV